MSESNAPIPWKHLIRTLRAYAPLWGGAVVLFGAAGIAYAFVRNDTWLARQPCVVRDEANSQSSRMGRFGSLEELKAAQETILEMAKNQGVVRTALERLGPPEKMSKEDWLSTENVARVAKNQVDVKAPRGSEFGSSEVIYIHVQAESPERAKKFSEILYDSLTEQLGAIRQSHAESVVQELTYVSNLAKKNLDEVAGKMRDIEIEFGPDLRELRNLNDAVSGEGTSRRILETTSKDLRLAEAELEKQQSLYQLLTEGSKDPKRLLISGGELLSSQPSLLKLKEGLIAAQLTSSRLAGRYKKSYPRLRSARKTESKIREELLEEVNAVIQAMEPLLARAKKRVAKLQAKKDQVNERIQKLASMRTTYAEHSKEVEYRTGLRGKAEFDLVKAQATYSAAKSTSLLAKLGPPEMNGTPEGPPSSLIALGATLAGLLFGFGAVFLIAPGSPQTSAGRWAQQIDEQRGSDHQGFGNATSSTTQVPPATRVPPESSLSQTPPMPASDVPTQQTPVTPSTSAEAVRFSELAESGPSEPVTVPKPTPEVPSKAVESKSKTPAHPSGELKFSELAQTLQHGGEFPGDRRKRRRD